MILYFNTEDEEIPLNEFREEPINDTNPGEEFHNEVRNLIIRLYLAFWVTVVLRSIATSV